MNSFLWQAKYDDHQDRYVVILEKHGEKDNIHVILEQN